MRNGGFICARVFGASRCRAVAMPYSAIKQKTLILQKGQIFVPIIDIEHRGPYVTVLIPFGWSWPYWVNIWYCDHVSEQYGFRFAVPLHADPPKSTLDHVE
eukprot:7301-Pyramimonas_sp.AAC.1